VDRRRVALLAVVACVLTAIFAAGGAGGSVSPTPHPAAAASAPGSPPAAPGDPSRICEAQAGTTEQVALAIDGRRRTALVHLPRRGSGRVPLILALHGMNGNGAFMESYSGLSRIADREGFAIAYPDSDGPRWRISASEPPSDVRFLDGLVDRLGGSACIDDDRVSAVGVSNGGGMAARFACEADDRLAGLVSVAGGYRSLPRCQAQRAISVLEIHGTADPVVRYYGRPGDSSGNVLGWVGRWARRDLCPPAARRQSRGPNVQRLDWGPCRAGTAVAHLRIIGGQHAWPGATPADRGPSFGVSASEEAWSFLRDRRRASASDKQ
jgi:polyhydroxybutyrate depolymerase